jgi:hypothetical protein
MNSKVQLSIGSSIAARRNILAAQPVTHDEGFARKGSLDQIVEKRTMSRKVLERASSTKDVQTS